MHSALRRALLLVLLLCDYWTRYWAIQARALGRHSTVPHACRHRHTPRRIYRRHHQRGEVLLELLAARNELCLPAPGLGEPVEPLRLVDLFPHPGQPRSLGVLPAVAVVCECTASELWVTAGKHERVRIMAPGWTAVGEHV